MQDGSLGNCKQPLHVQQPRVALFLPADDILAPARAKWSTFRDEGESELILWSINKDSAKMIAQR